MHDKTLDAVSVYDAIAQKYSEIFDGDRSDDSFIDEFLTLLPKHSRILDIGCGTGRLTARMHKKGYVVTGADLSDGMLAIAREKHPKIAFVRADMRHAWKDTGEFDAVTIAYSLFHMTKNDARRTIMNVKKILRKNGMIYLILQEGDGEAMIDEPLMPKKKIFIKLYTQKEIETMLELAGFRVLSTKIKKSSLKGELPYDKLIITAITR